MDTTDSKNAPANPDRDALDTLPLSMIPLTSNTLKNARLIKNSRLETAVELYNDPLAGSLQISPQDIAEQISASERDQEIINQLAGLQSYDVYSLRSSLKKLGIEAVGADALELSDDMKDSLGELSLQFTRPLVEKIFGSGTIDAKDSKALQKVFRDPDLGRVRENLKIMTQATGIPLDEIPKFLEEYSEVFLSVAYYRYSFESTAADAARFILWIDDLKGHRETVGSAQTVSVCKKTEETVKFLVSSVNERLMWFQSGFEKFWANINRASFHQLRHQVEENHGNMGSVLCGLSVKMRGWAHAFPDNNAGSTQKRIKYLMTELDPNLEKLRKMETEARVKLGLAAK